MISPSQVLISNTVHIVDPIRSSQLFLKHPVPVNAISLFAGIHTQTFCHMLDLLYTVQAVASNG